MAPASLAGLPLLRAVGGACVLRPAGGPGSQSSEVGRRRRVVDGPKHLRLPARPPARPPAKPPAKPAPQVAPRLLWQSLRDRALGGGVGCRAAGRAAGW